MAFEISDGILIVWLLFCLRGWYGVGAADEDFDGASVAKYAAKWMVAEAATAGFIVWSLWQFIGWLFE